MDQSPVGRGSIVFIISRIYVMVEKVLCILRNGKLVCSTVLRKVKMSVTVDKSRSHVKPPQLRSHLIESSSLLQNFGTEIRVNADLLLVIGQRTGFCSQSNNLSFDLEAVEPCNHASSLFPDRAGAMRYTNQWCG